VLIASTPSGWPAGAARGARIAACCLLAGCSLSVAFSHVPSYAADDVPPSDRQAIRAPVGPADLPESLPGRWKISLCVSDDNGHAWIRFENPETGDVRSIGRFHLLVGGWFEPQRFRWNYPPTFRTGLYMDREQRREPELADGSEILRTAWVDNPQLYVGGGPRGHAIVRNNCATYARDAWHFYTGEYWELPVVHTPRSLRDSVGREHPEVLTVGHRRQRRRR
jgi:hypothetical protein